MLLLIALLAQTPVDDHIAAFVKGDAAARAELVKLGAYAIRPLQKAREKAPEKIDALVFDLKKAAAFPQLVAFEVSFGKNTTRDGGGRFSQGFLGMIGDEQPFFLDSY